MSLPTPLGLTLNTVILSMYIILLQGPACTGKGCVGTSDSQHSKSFLRKGQGLARFSGPSPQCLTPRRTSTASGDVGSASSHSLPLGRTPGLPLTAFRECTSSTTNQSTPVHRDAFPSAKKSFSSSILLQPCSTGKTEQRHVSVKEITMSLLVNSYAHK